ncbi:hypothetical protein [Streptomyces sp. SLBN-134]|uniref:hypothetical protein n=1 Tax=Streptomyces sp. SLBN-134 TaxID=2768456 RepID=UPI00114EEB08|nr:hypothetical protein [Streptomyces sp. SLBN-134]TQL18979.1 hypothetical protein FBY37_0886 [Streptomyces sp. SLBN-134]
MSNETIPEPGAESGASDPASAAATGEGTTSAAPTDNAPAASVAEEEPHRAKSKTKPKPIITSIEDLLTFAYKSNARLLDFSKEDLKKLAITDEDIASQSALVGSLAPTDPTLSTPFKLLQYAARQGVPLKRAEDGDLARALNRLVELAVIALGHSPLFRVWVDQLVDPRKDPQLPTQHLRDAARQVGADELGLTSKQFKATERQRLVKNAIACYGLLRTLQREWTLSQFIDASYDYVWRDEAPKAAGLERAASEVGASSDLNVLGIVGANYLARIALLERQVTQLESEAGAARNREIRLSHELSTVKEHEQSEMARADALSADVVRLQKELAAERDNRVVDKSHMADDYETLRTRIIRRLGGEIDLLTDGLHALRNGAPNVAEEFLDRSLLALTREVEQLKDASGDCA